MTEDVQIAWKRGAHLLDGYLARPESVEGRQLPGVVVIHELFGLNDNIRDIARRFAAEGYVALAVDLFSGALNRRLCVMRVLAALVTRPRSSKGLSELRRALDWLQARPEVDAGRVGAIGFCMGGGYALGLACVDGDLRASSILYCTNPWPLRVVARACPIVGSYAGTDGFTSGSGRRLDAALDRFQVPHDIKVYDGADHSFFNDTLDNYNPAAAADSWARTLAFFQEHLFAGSATGTPPSGD
jgi:carboxymethylenebutenolidase